jgi:hypothetical protein
MLLPTLLSGLLEIKSPILHSKVDLTLEGLEHSTFQKLKKTLRKLHRVFIIIITTIILKIYFPLISLRIYVEHFHSIHVH